MLKYLLIYGGATAFSIALFLSEPSVGSSTFNENVAAALVPFGFVLIVHGIVLALEKAEASKKSEESQVTTGKRWPGEEN